MILSALGHLENGIVNVSVLMRGYTRCKKRKRKKNQIACVLMAKKKDFNRVRLRTTMCKITSLLCVPATPQETAFSASKDG